MNVQIIQNLYNELPEAKGLINDMFLLSEGYNEEFYGILNEIKKILDSKNIDYEDFIKRHLYVFMDVACKVNDIQFLEKYTEYLSSVTDFYRATGKFEIEDSFADEWFGDFIEDEREKSNKKFNINKVANVVFAYYTGYVIQEGEEFSYQHDYVMKFNKKFAKILLEKNLEYNYGDPESLIDELEYSNKLPSSFDTLGAYIEDNKLKFKNFDELLNPHEVYEICEKHFPNMKFEETNMFNSSQGIYYFQYKFEEKVSFKFINIVLKNLKKAKEII